MNDPFLNEASARDAREVLVVGSVALDSVETPAGRVINALGGAATYGSVACSLFAPVHLVGVVGEDFPPEHIEFLQARGIDLAGLQVVPGGHTFRWSGDYNDDLNQAVTHETQLGVFEHFEPHLPPHYRDAPFVFLANINPSLQLAVLDQVDAPELVVCDTMNLWINIARDRVFEVFSRVDVAILNDGEARMLTECDNTVRAGHELLERGPRFVVIKKGEHGSLLFCAEGVFAAPSFPLRAVADPTGAGDSFAGSLMGFLAGNGQVCRESLHEAMFVGAAVASATVEDFSLGALRGLSREEALRRVEAMKVMVRF